MAISSWSSNPNNNTSPSPNGAPEGMAPSGVNYVKVSGFLTFGANNTGDRVGVIHKNVSPNYVGPGSHASPAAVTSSTDFLVSTGIVAVSAGDYFQISAYQNSAIEVIS